MPEELASLVGLTVERTPERMLVSLLVSFLLAQVLAALYRWSYQGLSYSRTFLQALVLAALSSCMLILVVGQQWVLGLGLLGALTFVRFRTQVRDPRDTIFLFASLAAGVAAGAEAFSAALLSVLVLGLSVLYLHWASFSSLRICEGLVRFLRTAPGAADPALQALLKRYCAAVELVSVREAVQGEALEYTYQVRLFHAACQDELLRGLRSMAGVSEPSLLLHRATVEI